MVIWRGREVLRNPSNPELARRARAARPRPHEIEVCDLIVVGAGPAGLAAAVYGASEGLRTVALDGARDRRPGRHVVADRELPRLPGRRLRGRARRARDAPGARSSAPQLTVPADAVALEQRATAPTRSGSRWRPGLGRERRDRDRRALPPAAGAGARGVRGRTSVYYAATLDGGPALPRRSDRGRRRRQLGRSGGAVPGRLRARVDLVVREPELTENMSRYLADRIERNPNIEVHLHTEVRELCGEDALEARRRRGHTGPATASASRRARCSCSSGPRRTPTGWAAPSRSTPAATSSPAPEALQRRQRRRLRPAAAGDQPARACSPPATCAAARSSGSPSAVGEGSMAVRHGPRADSATRPGRGRRPHSDVGLVEEAPAPVLARLERLDDRVADRDARAGARGGPATSRSSRRGRTSGTAAGAPTASRAQALLAALGRARHDGPDQVLVGADCGCSHGPGDRPRSARPQCGPHTAARGCHRGRGSTSNGDARDRAGRAGPHRRTRPAVAA